MRLFYFTLEPCDTQVDMFQPLELLILNTYLRTRRSVQWLPVWLFGAIGLAYPASAGVTSEHGGAIDNVYVATGTTGAIVNSQTFSNLAGAHVSFQLAVNQKKVVVVRFSTAESCGAAAGQVVLPICLVRVVSSLNGGAPVEMAPVTGIGAVLGENQITGNDVYHAAFVERSKVLNGPGSFEIDVQFKTTTSKVFLATTDWSLSVETAPAK